MRDDPRVSILTLMFVVLIYGVFLVGGAFGLLYRTLRRKGRRL